MSSPGLAGQGDPDLDVLMVGEGEGACRPLARLEAAVVWRPVFVPVGCDRDRAGRRPGLEGPDAG